MTTTSPAMSPARPLGTAARRSVRRRDGLALAATGAIPARVRAQILAEHRADLDARARTRTRARVNAGLACLPIPYGYRRRDTQPRSLSAAWWTAGPDDPRRAGSSSDTHPNPTGPALDRGRAGRAQPAVWRVDPDCAETVWFMVGCLRYGMTPARTATLLDTAPDWPPLLSVSGHPRRWTARAVRGLLTDPLLTGHTVWGRTHHGQPVPRPDWIISAALTHPPILDAATVAAMSKLLTTGPVTIATDTATPDVGMPPGAASAAARCRGRGLRRRR